jgi:gamma-glutamylcysteine synthetase
MAAPKFKQIFDEMLLQNKQLFDSFRQIHDQFMADPKAYQQQFNEIGRDVQDVIRRYENRLCSHSESAGFGKFTNNLADKFQEEIKKSFSKIDSVGKQ